MPDILALRDGRQLEYSIGGTENGYPVILLHGLLGSAYLNDQILKLAEKHGIRLIAIARPGYGRSTPANFNCVSDWTKDAVEFLEQFNLNKYSILALSAGAPYGLALQANIIEKTSQQLVILSGLPAVYSSEIRKQYPKNSRRLFTIFRLAPRFIVQQMLKKMVDSFSTHFGDDHPVIKDTQANNFQGIYREVRLQQKNWGVNFDRLQEVYWFHGRNDNIVPLEAAKDTAQLIRVVDFNIMEDLNHMPEEHHLSKAFKLLNAKS